MAAAQGGAGTTTVQTNPSDPDPIISISNPTQVTANDIEFEVIPGAVRVDIDKTRMTDGAGNDLRWDKAVNHGGGKYSMKVGANGTGIAAGSGAGLELQSKTQSGWSHVVYSRTRNGRTLYTSVNLDSDTNPAGTVATGNTFPAGASAWLGITNTGSLAITDVTLSIDNEQVFESIGSELAGAGAFDLSANTATFYFDDALEPGATGSLYWDYVETSGSGADAEVTFTVGTSGLLLAHSSAAPQLRPGATTFRLPDMDFEETSAGSMGGTVRLVSDGTYTLGSPTRMPGVTSVGSLLGQPRLDPSGNIEIPVTAAGSEPSTLAVSDLIATTTAAGGQVKGPIYLMVESTGTSQLRVLVGYRR